MMNKYLNNGGHHTCLDGTTVRRGETVVTEEDLIAKFGSKFVLVADDKTPAVPATPAPAPVPATTPAEADDGVGNDPDAENAADAKNAAADNGMVDVTADFPAASAADLVVRKDKRGWWLFDGDADPVNEKPMKKKDVDGFILEYTAD